MPTPQWLTSLETIHEEVTRPGSLESIHEEVAQPGSLSPEVLEPPEMLEPDESDAPVWGEIWRRRWVVAILAALSFTAALVIGLWTSRARQARDTPVESLTVSGAQSPVPPDPAPPEPVAAPAVVEPPPAVPSGEPETAPSTFDAEKPGPAGKGRVRGAARPAAAVPPHYYTPNRI